MPYSTKDPKRNHNFDNHPEKGILSGVLGEVPSISVLRPLWLGLVRLNPVCDNDILLFARGPTDHISIRISDSRSEAQYMVSRILLFMRSLGAIQEFYAICQTR